ncbi:hypothetical protein AVEN_42333-1 [Araneus ventricosus]|uniref:Transposase Tc1-like domain-containing protein n=1 Tax=Araneus ventricosus TaxID=182803 RepID=A0A4Y2GPS7_ARAVE|nr:hypothetical protein AVEN_42333-1 [Araneus ventricosus]
MGKAQDNPQISAPQIAADLKADYNIEVTSQTVRNVITKAGYNGRAARVKGGIIRNTELILNRPLHWLVCQLHANELPLRHLFAHVDGTTTGPRSLTGEIRKSLAGCEKLPVVSSTTIEYTLCEVTNKKDLSTDQLYLIEICEVIKCSHCRESMSKINPRKVCHSRWLTTANRILRLNVAHENPS